ncbi:hypothetical protein D3C76_89470 [compost metagenome]
MLGRKLADIIGASALLYAAVAYFVFDDAFFLEDLSENYPDLEEDLTWWCDDFYAEHYTLLQNLRIFYETTDDRPRPHSPACRRRFEVNQPSFRLLKVVYHEPDEDMYITASRDPRDYKHGSVWRLPSQRPEGLRGHGDEPRRIVFLPFKRSRRIPGR